MSNIFGIPDDLFQILEATDAKHGFPRGTMAAILQQEVGGQLDKFLNNPAAYHYAVGEDGVRRGASGAPSSAFGPFGILDSTAKDPGWGVKPLQDKQDLHEHIRFAGDYLAARVKQAGSFEKGLAAYGEGDKYAAAVAKKIPGFTSEAPVQIAKAEPVPPAQQSPEVPVLLPEPEQNLPLPSVAKATDVPNEWDAFRRLVPRRDEPRPDPRQPQQVAGVVPRPDFSESLSMAQAMMGRNRNVLMDGWEAMRGWV